ncbi:MAG: Holliday junction branch migration protein RuvA [Phycisphaerae bacterium]|nr:Holliday junction branch migration protein RuvA [Phycisphaerae bacterium]
MIARISGRLQEMRGPTALVDTGAGLWYEVMVPATDAERLASRVGQDIALHTINHIEGDPTRGAMTPRLIGFDTPADRDFFRLFTTVKGIGVRKALRALIRPMGEIAAAIQAKDAKFLIALPEIGKRTAETIIAELHGKVEEFAGELSTSATESSDIPEAGHEAAAVLIQLGERRADALALVERVMAVAPELDSPEDIIQQVYKLKAGGG